MAPRGRLAVIHNRPPWASMIDRQIASPIPMPCALVVNSGLNIRSMAFGSTPFPVSSTDTSTLPESWTSDLKESTRCEHMALAVATRREVLRLTVSQKLSRIDSDRLDSDAGRSRACKLALGCLFPFIERLGKLIGVIHG